MTYLQWNDALARWIFSSKREGAPVFLYMDRDSIERAIRSVAPDAKFADFVAALRTGTPWDNHRNPGLCERALGAIRGNWRERRINGEELKWPPYLAYLILFTHAAVLEGEFSTGAYYARLRTCLGEGNANGTYPDFGRMEWLWEDLERWSNVDKKGELGRFQYFLYGNHRHVGAPQAQTLLSQKDRALLPWVFEQCEFDPSSPPREAELLSAFLQHGKEHLGVRTRKILEGADAKAAASAREVLAAIVTNDLSNWDGRVTQRFDKPDALAPRSSGEESSVTTGNLRLCATLDKTSGRFRAHLRCKTPIEFPDDGFWLRAAGQKSGAEFVAEEFDGSWSCPLEARATGAPLDVASLDWSAGWSVRDVEQNWKFRWRRAEVRLLTRDPEGILDDWIEVFRLPLGRPVWVLASANFADAVDAWGGKYVRDWERVGASGLPSGWALFVGAAVTDAAQKARTVPHSVLQAPSSVGMDLRGGVRVNRAWRFFDFALPRVEIEGAEDAILCWRELGKDGWNPIARDDDGLFSLPPIIADKNAVRLGVLKADSPFEAGQELAARTFYIEGARGHWRDAALNNGQASVETAELEPLALGGLVSVEADGALIYLGRRPGQIARFPAHPQGWQAVWIINGRRKRSAIYCGSALANEAPLAKEGADRKDLSQWKNEINTRVEAPRDAELNQLWKSYLQAAAKI